MVYYPKQDFSFVRFERSHLPKKKYDAILKNKATGRLATVPFGAIGYAQYKDCVLSLYSANDHMDKIRRGRY